MLGAIIGDVVGSIYEFHNIKSKDFAFFGIGCKYTDDTVMTVAVADALLTSGTENTDAFKSVLVDKMHYHTRRHLLCGFGSRFSSWVLRGKRDPYNSLGNGSAMRVSPVAYCASTLDDVLCLAKASAEVTHNHPDGIKGAEAIAGLIFLARIGKSKSELKAFAQKYFDLSFTLDSIRPTYTYDMTTQGSVPHSIVAFLESESFEDAIRNAVSIGGDSDTIAAITGSIAEAYYGIDDALKQKALEYLDDDFKSILLAFQETHTTPQ